MLRLAEHGGADGAAIRDATVDEDWGLPLYTHTEEPAEAWYSGALFPRLCCSLELVALTRKTRLCSGMRTVRGEPTRTNMGGWCWIAGKHQSLLDRTAEDARLAPRLVPRMKRQRGTMSTIASTLGRLLAELAGQARVAPRVYLCGIPSRGSRGKIRVRCGGPATVVRGRCGVALGISNRKDALFLLRRSTSSAVRRPEGSDPTLMTTSHSR